MTSICTPGRANRPAAVWIALAVLAFGSAAIARSGPAGRRLAMDYPPGVYRISWAETGQTRTQVGQRKVLEDSEKEWVFDARVGPADANGHREIRLKLIRAQFALTVAGRTVAEYDSTAPAEAQSGSAQDAYRALAEADIRLSYHPQQGVTRLEGLEDLWGRLRAKHGPQDALLESFAQQFNDQALTRVLGQARHWLPDRPVAVGDRWKSRTTYDVPLVGRLTAEREARLVEIQPLEGRDRAEVEWQVRARTAEPVQSRLGPATLTTRQVDVQRAGQLKLDLLTGLVHQMQANTVTRSSLTLEDDQKPARELTVHQQTTSEITVVEHKPKAPVPAVAPADVPLP